jgi:hypothetical protein
VGSFTATSWLNLFINPIEPKGNIGLGNAEVGVEIGIAVARIEGQPRYSAICGAARDLGGK